MAPSYFHSLRTLALWLLGSGGSAVAQLCWKDTPCSHPETAAFPGEWESNIFAPASRTVRPMMAFSLDSGQEVPSFSESFALDSSQVGVYLDFGLEVGGIISFQFEVSSIDGKGAVGLAFTEAKNWIGRVSDSSNGDLNRKDGAIYANFSAPGVYSYGMPIEYLRGGFRYLTLFALGKGASLTISNVQLELSFQPTWSNLRAYQGYFHSSDNLLNKIWYSGAYTLQIDAIHPATGRVWTSPPIAWNNAATIGPGDTINTDGAKRDRTVWPGDMGVAVPASFYSTGDLESVRNALQCLYDNQDSTGLLPFSGPPLSAENSDTYHMWSLIGTYNYVLFSGDTDFLAKIWPDYVKAVGFLQSEIQDALNLVNITTHPNDWGRLNATNTLASAQMLGYHTLVTGATLAEWVGDATGTNTEWLDAAKALKEATMTNLWDDVFGAFKDNLGAWDFDVHPQDGNSLAVLLGVVDSASDQAQKVSSYLIQNWTPIGAETPELPGEIAPFISSFEIQAHLLAGQTQRALDLIRRSWGWYLNNENGTQSTMIEGYLTDGTFGYRHDAGYGEDYSYTSHAHGWSTGPVTALTEHIVGLSVTGQAGSTWRLAPQFGDLTHAEAGFTTKLGRFTAGWTLNSDGSYVAVVVTPQGTKGAISILRPEDGVVSNVLVNGGAIDGNSVEVVQTSGGRELYNFQLDGGEHRIEVSQ